MQKSTSVFDPVKYIPASERNQLRAWSVRDLLAVAHEPLEVGGNHWCFYLQIEDSDGTESVCIDTIPSHITPSSIIPGGSKSYTIISKKPSPIHQRGKNEDAGTDISFMKICRLPVSKDKTVGDIVDLLIQRGRHRYEFSSEGTGCRKWVSDQIWLLSDVNLVTDVKEVLATDAAIKCKFPSGLTYPIDEGAYY